MQEKIPLFQEKIMKKNIIKIASLLLIASLSFFSCSKNNSKKVELRKPSKNIDSTTWINNLIDGKAAAKEQNKKIILFVSVDDSDATSAKYKTELFNTEDFLKKATENYVLVNIDLSSSIFEQAQTNTDASENDQKKAQALRERLEENIRDVTLYNVNKTPVFLLLNSDGYVVSELTFPVEENSSITMDIFDSTLQANAETISVFDNVLESTTSSNKEDKIAAINRLFEITSEEYHYLLKSKAEEYISLDKNNETGKVGDYVLSITNANAVEAFLRQDPEGASVEFAAAAENKFLSPEQSQQCYYTAGYLFSQSQSATNEKIIEYLQKAYDAAPESDYAETIKTMISAFAEQQAEEIQSETQTQE